MPKVGASMPGRLREFVFLDWHQFLISAISKTEIGGWWEVHFGGQKHDFVVFGWSIFRSFQQSYNKRDGGFMCVVFSIGKPLYLVIKNGDYGMPL